jgi:proteasome lid subunit RPN8/RPN11
VIRWEEKPPDVTFGTFAEWNQRLTVIDVCSIISGSSDVPFIHFRPHIRENIFRHVSTKKTELGGLLLGKIFRLTSDPSSRVVLIDVIKNLESTDFNSTGVSLTMNTELWNQARSSIDCDTNVVGWYHSHPNLGAFFSGTDRHTQASVFNHDYSLGLVVDPIRIEEKWFLGASSNDVPAEQIRNF